MSHSVFVFGSNEAGIHGAGAARVAKNRHGAVMGQGYGHYGDSFAIPTKDRSIQTLPLDKVKMYVANFISYAKKHPELEFQLTQIGCGLAGFLASQIAPLFKDAPENVYIDSAWSDWLPEHKVWGTYAASIN